jgi:anti-anti-sigma factor
MTDARPREEGDKARRAASPESGRTAAAEQVAAAQFAIEALSHRRTALVALNGELDLSTVSQVTDVLAGLSPRADGLRHIVLDLRGLTFMDSTGLHALMAQSESARSDRYNFAVVRGSDSIERLLKLSGVAELLVLVDDPDDLVPPPHAD